jgi:hypothetical protein
MKLGEMLKKSLGHSGDSDDAEGASEEPESGDEMATEMAQEVIDAGTDASKLAPALARFVMHCSGESAPEPESKKGVALVLGK